MTPESTDALIIVDMQNDFTHGGALPVEGAERIVPLLNRAMMGFGVVVLTRDWHPANHCSFADPPTYQDGGWPMHCVQHSPGAEFYGGLHVPSDAIIVDKGDDPDQEAYSGFQGTQLAATLRQRGVERVFVGGVATDFCVRATALDARKQGFEVVLLEDACRGVAPEASAAAIEEMRAAGVRIGGAGELD